MTEQRDVRIPVTCLCVEKLFAYAKLVVRRETFCVQYKCHLLTFKFTVTYFCNNGLYVCSGGAEFESMLEY
jgi:hypothetical protein